MECITRLSSTATVTGNSSQPSRCSSARRMLRLSRRLQSRDRQELKACFRKRKRSATDLRNLRSTISLEAIKPSSMSTRARINNSNPKRVRDKLDRSLLSKLPQSRNQPQRKQIQRSPTPRSPRQRVNQRKTRVRKRNLKRARRAANERIVD